MEIYQDPDNPNMFIVTGPLFRDPAVVIYTDQDKVMVFDNQLDLGKKLKALSKTMQEINGLTFLTMVGEDATKFYNRILDDPEGLNGLL